MLPLKRLYRSAVTDVNKGAKVDANGGTTTRLQRQSKRTRREYSTRSCPSSLTTRPLVFRHKIPSKPIIEQISRGGALLLSPRSQSKQRKGSGILIESHPLQESTH